MLTLKFQVSMARTVLFCFFVISPVLAETKQVSGWIEKVAVSDPKLVLPAKIDTGARNSSIHAGDFMIFSKQGNVWVKFSVSSKDGESRLIERPVKRFTKIKQKNNKPSKQRPVIVLGVCLSNVYKEVEVNLVDRANFNYPMLVGRSFLAGSFVVDSGEKYLTTPKCNFQ
ncbi:MAG: RimK/LysX family protein [Gammaproteobacteria bacterium]